MTQPQFEALVRAIVSARCQVVAGRATPSRHATPNAAGQPGACHFAAPRFGAQGNAAGATPAGPAPALDGLAGVYELAPGQTFGIVVENGNLFALPPGRPRRPLTRESGTTFVIGDIPQVVTLTFVLGADGRATAMTMRQNGSERTLTRVRDPQ